MTSATLRLIHKQEQQEIAARHNGSNRRAYETRWVIERMRDALPPDHVALARRIRDLSACAAGLRLSASERVDASNGAEAALLSRLDASQAIAGYSNAVGARLGPGGRKCLAAIADEYTMAQTLKACGFAARSWQSVRQLVQLTMMAAQDYADECTAQHERWRAL